LVICSSIFFEKSAIKFHIWNILKEEQPLRIVKIENFLISGVLINISNWEKEHEIAFWFNTK
jgi:hypothetical protein